MCGEGRARRWERPHGFAPQIFRVQPRIWADGPNRSGSTHPVRLRSQKSHTVMSIPTWINMGQHRTSQAHTTTRFGPHGSGSGRARGGKHRSITTQHNVSRCGPESKFLRTSPPTWVPLVAGTMAPLVPTATRARKRQDACRRTGPRPPFDIRRGKGGRPTTARCGSFVRGRAGIGVADPPGPPVSAARESSA